MDPTFRDEDIPNIENFEQAHEILQEPEPEPEIEPRPGSSRAAANLPGPSRASSNLPGPSQEPQTLHGFPASRKRRIETRQMGNERMEFVQSISSLARATQEASSKSAEHSIAQNIATKTAEITANAIVDATKTILSAQNNKDLTPDEKMVKAFCGYVEARFNLWGAAKKKAGVAIISRVLEDIEELQDQ